MKLFLILLSTLFLSEVALLWIRSSGERMTFQAILTINPRPTPNRLAFFPLLYFDLWRNMCGEKTS